MSTVAEITTDEALAVYVAVRQAQQASMNPFERLLGIHIDTGNGPEQIDRWNVWNEEWDCPLIEPTRDSFERFLRGRLAEPGMLADLVAAGGER